MQAERFQAVMDPTLPTDFHDQLIVLGKAPNANLEPNYGGWVCEFILDPTEYIAAHTGIEFYEDEDEFLNSYEYIASLNAAALSGVFMKYMESLDHIQDERLITLSFRDPLPEDAKSASALSGFTGNCPQLNELVAELVGSEPVSFCVRTKVSDDVTVLHTYSDLRVRQRTGDSITLSYNDVQDLTMEGELYTSFRELPLSDLNSFDTQWLAFSIAAGNAQLLDALEGAVLRYGALVKEIEEKERRNAKRSAENRVDHTVNKIVQARLKRKAVKQQKQKARKRKGKKK